MSVLSRIRSRAGLLVAVIGIALFAFILGDIFTSGRSMFTSRETNVGVIAGEEISIVDFQRKVQEQLNQMKESNPNAQIDEASTDQVVQQLWNQTVSEKIFFREFDRVGISVSADELTDRMVGKDPDPVMNQYFQDPQTHQIRRDFATPDGRLNMALVRKYVSGLTDKDEKYWVQLEKYIRDNRRQVKYMNLIKKGLYITTAQARQDSADAAIIYNIKYVSKKYNTASDSAIQVTDAELLTWYNAHQYKYKIKEATRGIEFVTFDIKPSAKDIDDMKTDLKGLVAEFKTKTGKEDSAFVQAESDSRRYNIEYHKKGTLPASVDSMVSISSAGTVLGPVEDNGKLTLYKVLGTQVSSDSAKVRHLLVGYKGPATRDSTIHRTKEQAKLRADSLFNLVKTKKKKLEDLIDQFSDDGGKKAPEGKEGHGGIYGWFTQESQLVPEFKKAGLTGKKGEITVVETAFGYHIIEVLDKTKESEKNMVVTIERQEQASKATIDSVYLKANTFAGKNVTTEQFEKAVAKEGMNKRVAAEIHATDRTINGLDAPKELVRWVYADDRKKNEVSQPFQLGERFVIATLISMKEKGIAPLEEVKDRVTAEVKKQKKAEKFMDEMAKASAGVSKIDDLASKMREPAQTADNVNFSNSFIPGIGQEQGLIGDVVCAKPDMISKPVQGNSAVYVFTVVKSAPVGMTPDVKTMKKSKLQNLQSTVDSEVFDVLKENADIKDNRAKFF